MEVNTFPESSMILNKLLGSRARGHIHREADTELGGGACNNKENIDNLASVKKKMSYE
jgi:hypothetical protein